MKRISGSSLYNSRLLVPCLFNSGCGIGKRGITSIDLEGGEIRLVHWFDRIRSKKYFEHNGNPPERLGGIDYYRTVLKKDCLDCIFTRIKLLA